MKHISKRIFAGFIDYSLIMGYFLALLFLFGERDEYGENQISGFYGMSVLIFWFFITVFFEVLNGASIGNMVMKLKVMSIDESKLTIKQSIKRHLGDFIDMSFFGFVGFVLLKNTKQNRRFGDIWAGTIVIEIEDRVQVKVDAD